MKSAVPMVALFVAYGCSSSAEPQPSAEHASGASGTGGAGEGAPLATTAGRGGACAAAASPLMIAGAPLRAALPLQLTAELALTGEGLALTEMAQQNPSMGLRWQGDRMFLLSDMGFWDIPVAGPARWYTTSSILLWGVRAGDFDGDGDFDLLVLSMLLNPNLGADLDADTDAGSAEPASPLASRLTVWERGPEDSLSERAELLNAPGMSFPMPYELGDLDADGDLDVVTFERGIAVGYLNQGAFQLTRRTLSEPTPGYETFGALRVQLADRNGDGLLDLLVVGGDPLMNPLENRTFVLLGQAAGRFGQIGASAIGKSPLVPHGPDGIGIGIADVTGDGLADVLMQDPAAPDDGIIRLHVSTSATELAPVVELSGLGFGFGDVDGDGLTDVLTTRSHRLHALLARPSGDFEPRDLGIDTAAAAMLSFVVDPTAPAVHLLHKPPTCPAR